MDSKDKFTGKVDNYSKYRPSYPEQFIDYLVKEVGLTKQSEVADVGAGTGILTRLIAENVKTVYAIEPNPNMLKACQEYCSRFGNILAQNGSAENSGLPDDCVDFITVAQAFHWFDREKTKIEFSRILKPEGKVTLVWNYRPPDDPLVEEFDAFCYELCPNYKGSAGGSAIDPSAYREFFRNGKCDYRVFDNQRRDTLDSYIGGSLSASYAPAENDAAYGKFVSGLTDIFRRRSSNGILVVTVQTHSFTGLI